MFTNYVYIILHVGLFLTKSFSIVSTDYCTIYDFGGFAASTENQTNCTAVFRSTYQLKITGINIYFHNFRDYQPF